MPAIYIDSKTVFNKFSCLSVCLSVRLPACMLNLYSLSMALITCEHSLAVCLFAVSLILYLNIFLSVLFSVVSLSGYVLSCLSEYLSSCLSVCLLVYQFCNTLVEENKLCILINYYYLSTLGKILTTLG